MFIDASVIVAILAREPGWEAFDKTLDEQAGPLFFSPFVRFEAVQSIIRKQRQSGARPSLAHCQETADVFEEFVHRLGLQEIPISPEIGQAALAAGTRYGKAVGHPAGLNFGDCFAYACAKTLAVPLAYIGNDFSLTDLA